MEMKMSARRIAIVGAGSLLLPCVGHASVYGFLGNFDVVNDTGSTAHGFEIELEDLHLTDISDVFGGPGRGFPTGKGFDPATSVVRYGAPAITEYTNGASFGVRVTYRGAFNGSDWDFGTPSGTFITPGDNCWSGGGVGYGPGTPCDHFGVGTTKNATKTTYSWLLESATPGELTKSASGASLPTPVWEVVADPVNPDAPPLVIAEIEAPDAQLPNAYGEAMWVKIFKTELEDDVELEALVGGSPEIEGAVVETEWKLLQDKPGRPAADKLRLGEDAPVGANAEAVLRRYEFFAFTGEYDPENHEALVVDDANPLPEELGHYLGAQNVGVNLNVAPVPVPAALPLMLGALGALGALRRRAV